MAVRAAATSPPVHDSARAIVAPRARDRSWMPRARACKFASATPEASAARAASPATGPSPVDGPSLTLGALGLGRCRPGLEEPRLGDPALAQRPERLAVQAERGRTRRTRPDLDRALPGERELLAVVVGAAGPPDRRVDLAVDPDLDPGVAALDRHDQVDPLVGDRHVPLKGC